MIARFCFGRSKYQEIPTYNVFIIKMGRYLSVTLVTFQPDSLGWSQRLAGKWANFAMTGIQYPQSLRKLI